MPSTFISYSANYSYNNHYAQREQRHHFNCNMNAKPQHINTLRIYIACIVCTHEYYRHILDQAEGSKGTYKRRGQAILPTHNTSSKI